MKRVLSLAILPLLLITADSRAQVGKNPQIVSLFREVTARPNQSTVRVLVDGQEAALGTIVSADGWILSKKSELNGTKIVVRLPGGKELEAKRFGYNEPYDLIMLKVEATGLTPVVWTDSTASRVGHWVASASAGKEPAAVGVLSVAAREVKGAKFMAPTGVPGGYLGIALDLDFAGVKVQETLPSTPASKAGIKAADQILAVNGEMVQNPDEFLAVLSRKKPGDAVTLKIARADKEIDLKATLGERPGTKDGKSRGEMQNKMGSELSVRKAGFPVILQHDAILRPKDCGGPLVNLNGQVLGINISRAGRTETYAIPSEAVRPLLDRLKKSTGEVK